MAKKQETKPKANPTKPEDKKQPEAKAKPKAKTKAKPKETPKVKRVHIPASLKGHELFRVGEGSYFRRSNDRLRLDPNGCLTGEYLRMYSTPKVWQGEIAAGHLVDVTNDCAKPSANPPSTDPERITS